MRLIWKDIIAVTALFAALVGVAFGSNAYFTSKESPPDVRKAESEQGARVWAYRLSIPLTGVDCDTRNRCTIAIQGQRPTTAFCDKSGCVLGE